MDPQNTDSYRTVRRCTEVLCEPLAAEDYVVQSMPDASPVKWHLAHTTWFFETFLLVPVDTPLHKNEKKETLRSLNPMGVVSSVKDIADAVLFLTDAATVTGQILYVDGGAHFGRW